MTPAKLHLPPSSPTGYAPSSPTPKRPAEPCGSSTGQILNAAEPASTPPSTNCSRAERSTCSRGSTTTSSPAKAARAREPRGGRPRARRGNPVPSRSRDGASRPRGPRAKRARRRALVAFGGVETTREAHRDGWGVAWIGDLGRDARYAVRTFARNPMLAGAAIVTLALGIGANAADLLRRERVSSCGRSLPRSRSAGRCSGRRTRSTTGISRPRRRPTCSTGASRWRAFEDVAAYSDFRDDGTVTGLGEPRRLLGGRS